ncbi:hypothetical protein [Psychroserpens luteolus]|uniref:hypothetical protein n=1 Tax=Psychroserpens luteolus TaxID=2855840 RepID=UPI001E45732F|nr:hypothetical protein [Psychroserpens luteolus]MCD2260714.1 hypothetical protein [Psychroserpens luteolus]
MNKKSAVIILSLILWSCTIVDKSIFLTIETTSNPDAITIDGKAAEISDIIPAVQSKTKHLDSVQRSQFYIKLKIDEDTTMGIVSDIKYELRKANALNLQFIIN